MEAELLIPDRWQPGETIADLYEVKGIVGSGGMGLVYRVHHAGWNLDLAVKSPRPEVLAWPGAIEEFEREAQTWVKLGLHPHIVSCYYVRRLNGIPHVFAEYVDGGDLAAWIRSGKLYAAGPHAAVQSILDIAIQVAWGLRHAHAQRVVHQDVKPANVLLSADGTAKITDFGLARAGRVPSPPTPLRQRSAVSPRPPTTHVSWGGMTPAYCSPEQAVGQRLTRCTDVWSWAVAVLEMFVGKASWYAGPAAPAALKAYLAAPRDPRLPPMPADLAELLLRCLVRRPADRPNDLHAVADELIAMYRQATGTAYPRATPQPADGRADGLNNRAVSLLDLNRRGEAEALLERALAIEPHHAEAAYNLGLLQWRWGRLTDEALVARLAEATTARAQSWQYPYRLGLVHLERADAAEAIRTLEAAACEAHASAEVTPVLAAARAGAGVWAGCLWSLDCPSAWYAHHLLMSPDGWLALFDADAGIEVWDLNAGQRLRRLHERDSTVTALALNSAGRYLLSGDRQGTLSWWDLSTGRCLRSVEGHRGAIAVVMLSGDGRHAVSGAMEGDSGTLVLRDWDLNIGQCVHRVALGPRADLGGLCISPDRRRAAWVDAGRLHVWDLLTNRRIETIRVGETTGALALDWQHDRAVTAGPRHGIRLWELATGDCVTQCAGGAGTITALTVASDGRRAVTAGRDQMLRLWDLTSGRCLRTVSAGDGVLIALDADGQRAVTRSLCGTGCTLRIWSLRHAGAHAAPFALARPKPAEVLAAQAARMQETLCDVRATLENGEPAAALERLATIRRESEAGHDSAVRELWRDVGRHGRRTSLRDVWRVQQLTGAGPIAGITPDGRRAIAASNEAMELRVWDLAAGRPLRTLRSPATGGPLCSAVVMPDGRGVIAGRIGGELLQWDLATGQLVRALHATANEPERVLLSATPDGGRLLRGMGASIQLWDLATGRCVLNGMRTHAAHATRAVAISPDGRCGLSSDADVLLLWDLSTGRVLRRLQGHTARVLSAVISPDGRTALSASADRTVRHWDLATGRRLVTLAGHTARVLAVAYSPDARWAVSASADHTIRIWELSTGQCVHALDGHAAPVPSITLTPDGRWLLSGGADATVCLWELDWDYAVPAPADWEDAARPYLEIFLTQRSRRRPAAPPYWDMDDFQSLLEELRLRGHGWLRPAGVRRVLEDMTAAWTGPPPLV